MSDKGANDQQMMASEKVPECMLMNVEISENGYHTIS